LLGEVDIDAKYDSNAHLFKLFEMNSKKRNVKDTTLYYSFVIEYEIPELNQKEIMKGIIRHTYKKGEEYSKTYICKIDLYSNTIKDKEGAEPYDYIEDWLDNRNFLDYRIKSKRKREKNIEILKNQDTTIFKVKYLNNKAIIDNFYYGFINNKNIYLFEESYSPTGKMIPIQKLAKPIKYVSTRRYYYMAEFVNDDNLLYPKSVTRLREYFNMKDEKKPVKMVMRASVKTIPNPNLESELNIRMRSNTTEYMKEIKETYPNLVIPSTE
jgi:hypothetical protein